MSNIGKTERQLIVADEGFIGVASALAETGDLICYLIGCAYPVVLREANVASDTANATQQQYRVIDPASICLSVTDEKRYSEFIMTNGTRPVVKNARRNELLRMFRREGKYEEFQLV